MFDSHTHVDTIRCEDIEMMSLAGIKRLLLAVGPNGSTVHTTLLDYYRQLLTVHSERVRARGIEPYLALGIHPLSIPSDYEVAIKKLASQLRSSSVVAVGEIGIHKGDQVEEAVFEAQVEMAKDKDMPIVVHTPMINKASIVKGMLKIVKKVGFDPSKVVVDHATPEVLTDILSAGAVPGLTLRSDMLTTEQALEMLSKHGRQVVLGSDANGLRPSDPLAVPRLIQTARLKGIDDSVILQASWDNSNRIFGL